jgi:hypothetical protein
LGSEKLERRGLHETGGPLSTRGGVMDKTEVVGYKVVKRLNDGSYGSAILSERSKAFAIYRPKNWTRARTTLLKAGLGLTYFGYLEQAFTYKYTCGTTDLEVWKCEVRHTLVVPDHRSDLWDLLGALKVVVKKFLIIHYYSLKWPDGTRMAEEIKLLEEVF